MALVVHPSSSQPWGDVSGAPQQLELQAQSLDAALARATPRGGAAQESPLKSIVEEVRRHEARVNSLLSQHMQSVSEALQAGGPAMQPGFAGGRVLSLPMLDVNGVHSRAMSAREKGQGNKIGSASATPAMLMSARTMQGGSPLSMREGVERQRGWQSTDLALTADAALARMEDQLPAGGGIADAEGDSLLQTFPEFQDYAQPDHGDWRTSLAEKSPLTRFLASLEEFLLEDGRAPKNCFSSNLFKFVKWYERVLSKVEPARVGRLAEAVAGWQFEAFIFIVIIVNTIFTAMALNKEVTLRVRGLDDELDHFEDNLVQVEACFLVIYIVEMIMKLAVHREFFFISDEALWNIFDACLVLLGLIDFFLLGMQKYDFLRFYNNAQNMPTWLRAMRIAKVGRILRAVKALRLFEELRIMVDCILWSFASLFWTIMIICITVYMFSLFFMSGVVQYLKDHDGEFPKEMHEYFGWLSRTALTLFAVTTGGYDWHTVFVQTESLGPEYAVLFLFYMAFFIMVLFNIVTSMFLEKVLKHAEPSAEAILVEREQMETKDMEELRALFKRFDKNQDDMVSIQEFLDVLQHKGGDLGAFLAARGIDIKEAKAFFMIMKTEAEDGKVKIEHLVSSCTRLKGYATAVDLAILRNEMRTNQQNLHRMLASIHRVVGGGSESMSTGLQRHPT